MRNWLICCETEMKKSYTEVAFTYAGVRFEFWFCEVCGNILRITRVPPNYCVQSDGANVAQPQDDAQKEGDGLTAGNAG